MTKNEKNLLGALAIVLMVTGAFEPIFKKALAKPKGPIS